MDFLGAALGISTCITTLRYAIEMVLISFKRSLHQQDDRTAHSQGNTPDKLIEKDTATHYRVQKKVAGVKTMLLVLVTSEKLH